MIDEVSAPLAIIFDKSMDEGVVPQQWRDANVTPIYKKGSKYDPGNYRPVSLTSILCKIMESCVYDDAIDHLLTNQLLASSQHGFLRNKSCLTNLLQFLEVITEAVDNGDAVDLIYLDFAKAFDKVPRMRLISKLRAHGIEGKVLQWIKSWLTGRRQRVVLNGEYSEWINVLSGVPQGSVLGPLCFVIFINDIDDAVKDLVTIISKFADDTKIGQIIHGSDSCNSLQTSLDNLHNWAKQWGMQFNSSKCKVMHVSSKKEGFDYNMNGSILSTTSKEKDVGVIIHESLKPSLQCVEAARKANFVLGQISRAFHYRDRKIFINLYKKYVRVHLEFCAPAWSPWTQKDKDILEKVQQRAVKMVSGLSSNTYEERLLEIGLQSLEDRRKRLDMVQTFKIIQGIDNVDKHHWFTFLNDSRSTDIMTRASADNLNLQLPRSRTEVRKNFFSSRVVPQWNSLPYEVKRSKTVTEFKRKYDQVLQTNNQTSD